jgi:DNA transposition AAA+ family ATPase
MDRDRHDEAAQHERDEAVAQETGGDSRSAGLRPADRQLFITTKQHRRFTEFADAVRLDRYIGLCYGPPGVGKTLSARRYACWHELLPMLRQSGKQFTRGSARDDWHTIIYTPPVSASPRMIDKELRDLGTRLAMIRTPDPFDRRNRTDDAHSSPPFVELLIVDEADRLKAPALEQLRDHYDRSHLGLILIGMPGIEKTLARYPQLYSRIGFVHEYRPLSAKELTFVLQRHWSEIGLTLSADDFTDTEALAAVHRITSGNFRLVHRLLTQVNRILEINGLRTITREVVETARESLVIGTL